MNRPELRDHRWHWGEPGIYKGDTPDRVLVVERTAPHHLHIYLRKREENE